MPYTLEKHEDNKVTVTITIPKDEVEAGMRHAAEHLSEETKIPGFRPGKANYDVVKQRLGEMPLLEAAAEELIRNAFVKAMLEEDLETVGQPYFDVVKMAPGNDMVVKVEIALYPHVKKITDYTKLEVKKHSTEPTAELVERAKKDLAMMQTKETRAASGYQIKKGDKVVLNLGMKKDGVVVEGGEGQDHGIYTAEDYYIEGFIDQILGLKEGDEKTFTLKFPKTHYQKNLADQNVEFSVKINQIFTLEAPELNDEFAKSVGLKSAKELDEKLMENLKQENEVEESIRLDKEILDMLAEKSEFEKIPDILVNQEIDKMLHELKHSINERGMEFEEYLKQINKTLPEIKLDFTAPALRRIEVAILLKEIAKVENLKVENKEIDDELDKIAARYEDQEAKKRVYEPVFREYVERQLINRKTIEFLKNKMVK